MPRLVVPSLFFPRWTFVQGVEFLVVGEDQVGVAAQPEPAGGHPP